MRQQAVRHTGWGTNNLIANVHSVISLIKDNMKHKYVRFSKLSRRQKCLDDLQSVYPALDEAAIENLLDGFYCIDEDGSILVDNVVWGRR